MSSTIRISESLYRVVVQEAASRRRSPDEFAEEVLARHLLLRHPHVEIVESRSGPRAVIRGTRIGVDVVVGYCRSGCTPEQLAADILPTLTLAEIHDALSYYYDHPTAIDQVLAMRDTGSYQTSLKERLGQVAYERLTGEERLDASAHDSAVD